jgi:hypothetical protein
MNRKSVGSLLFVVLIVLLCLVAACTTDQFTQKESKTKGPLTAEERARQAEEARVLESMWYEGSAYHRGRDDSGAVDVGKWMRNRKEMKAQQEETEKRLAKLEKKAEKQQPAEAQVQGVGSESTAAVAAPVAAANKGAKSQQPLRFKVAIVFMPTPGSFWWNQRRSKRFLPNKGSLYVRKTKRKLPGPWASIQRHAWFFSWTRWR